MQDLTQNSSDISQFRFNWKHLTAAIALRIRESLDLPTILQTTADEVHQLLGSDRVLLYQFAPDWGGQVVVESVSELRWSLLDRVVRDTCFEACWIEHYQEGKYAAIADVANANLSSCYADFLNNFEIKANLVVPLLCESQLWGLLIAHYCGAPHQWQPEEISGLQQIAFHIGIAIYQSSLLKQLQVTKANLEAQVAERTVELEQANQQLLGRMDECNLKVNELDRHKSQLAQLAVIVESSQDAIMSKTLNGILTSWNQAAERLFGYKAEEIIGKYVTELIPQERQFEEDAICRKIYQGERVDTYETQRKHKDGTLLDVALTISPIKDANGTVIGASKIARDISGRKRLEFERIQAENELRQSKEQLEDFFENVSDLIQSVSLKDGRFLFVNRAWREVLGYRSEEISNLNVFDLLAPECMPACQELFQQLQSGKVSCVEQAKIIFIAKDGRKVFLEGNINVRQENGTPIATRTIFRDVTAQRQTEHILNEQTATLQSFYNSAPLMMGVVELSENDILHISDNLATMKFFNSNHDEIIGKWSSELGVSSEHIELWYNHYRHSQEQRQPVSFEYDHVTEVATYCLLVTVSFIDINNNSQRPRFCYIAQDISDRKQSELALKQSEATNEALIQAIPDFLVRMRRDGMQTEVLNHGAIHCLYPENGISGNYVSDIMPLEIAQERMRLAEIVIATGQVQKQEYQFIDQGKTYYEKARIAPLWNDEVLVVVGDITDRKLAEETLRQSEARFQHLVAHVPSIIYTIVHPVNAPPYFEYISAAVVDIFEVSPEQVYADMSILLKQWHPEDLAAYEAMVRHCISNLEPFIFEWRIITPSGKLKWLDVHASVERRDNGDVVGNGVLRDVSDRKQTELALQSSEAKYRHLINNLHAGFALHATDTSLILVNSNACDLLGLTLDQMLGKTAIDPAWHFFREDLTVMPLEEYPVNQVLRTGLPLRNYVLGINRSDHTQVWILVNAFPEFDANQQIQQVAITFIDISDRKQAEAKLQKISERLDLSLKSGAIGCWDWDISQNIILWDERMYELYGVTKQSDSVVYDIWANGVHPDDRTYTESLLRQAVLGQAEYDTEFRVIHPDQSIKFIKAYGIVVRDAQGNPTSMIGVNFDVSDRKQAELKLKSVNQQLSDRIAELNQRHAEMVTLGEISDFLQACFTVQEACNALSQLVEPLFPDCAGGVFITNTSRNRVEVMSSWGESLQSEDAFLPKDCWALRRGRLHFHADNGVSCNHIPPNEAIAATLCIPMIAQGETIGLFYLSTNMATALPEPKQQLARTLAEQVGLAISNLRLQETLQQQSIRDPLTGLFNRRYLEESLNQELSRAQRQQHQIGVIMIDIDHFKKFNDTYGHDAGDYVLQTVGTLLKKYVRGSDIACRYGGEEMILILPDSTIESASVRAEEIREAIAQISLSHNSQLLGSLTASLGVASFPQHGATGSAVMQSADAALYRAKAAGRNQVLIAP